jgi:eukaryotic-like serine/threonine-protein kinase
MDREDSERPEGPDNGLGTRSLDAEPGGDRGAASTEAPEQAEPEQHISASGDPLLPPGTRAGEYVIERVLGSGGFGTVYEALQPVIRKRVAIKVLAAKYSFDPKAVARFAAEARVTNQIGHPNILGVFSFGRLDDGRHYHVMDFVAGETLETLIRRRGALPLDEALPILTDIASALDAAHRQGVVHRDLKPANVLLTQQGERLIPKVIDFGVAKLLADDTKVHKTKSGALMGTPLYMSPEQCRGRSVDHRSDVYSFGVVTYEILTGKPPFDGKDAVDLLVQHTSQNPAPPSRIDPAFPPELDDVLLGLLEKDPDRRPSSLGEVVSRLATITAGEAVAAAPRSMAFRDTLPARDSVPPASAEPERSFPGARTLVLVAVALASGAGLVFALRGAPADPVVAKPEPVLSTASAPVQTAPAATSTLVRIELTGAPEGTEVRGAGGKLLGSAPGVIELARSADPVELELSRSGYGSLIREVIPDRDRRVEVTLRPLATATPAAKVKPARAPRSPHPDEAEQPKW